MKVKELATMVKVSVETLNKLLDNIGVDGDAQGETIVDADIEKKVAKAYNISYPFKKEKPVSNKPVTKPKTQNVSNKKPLEKPGENKDKTYEQKKPNQSFKGNTFVKQPSPKKPVQGTKPVSKPAAKSPATTNTQQKPVSKKPIFEEEFVAPRIDEATLAKYGDFLEDENFVGHSTKIKKKNTQDSQVSKKKKPVEQILIKKKNSNKNKIRNKGKEARTSNVPVGSDENTNIVYYELGMTVSMMAEAIGEKVTQLVKKLFSSMGIMATATQALDRDTAELICLEYGFELEDKKITDMVRFDEIQISDDDENLEIRPAIVTIMGHVDHGKTTLLDTIRSSHVTSGEAGGITQHIGAYQVKKSGKLITFIDTPGHAAFTEMRARGAQITDIVVLVVAADDGVMPQTKEAIEHAKAAGVPIIVAINKMDRPGANPDRIKQELTEHGLVSEDWGGDTIFVPISALTGKGVDELLEMIILTSDLQEYKANPNRLGIGTVIDAKLTKGRGAVATLLVQNGTIKVGDIIVVGNTYGKIRAMTDELGHVVKQAGPSKPVEITGITEVPFAGEKFMAINDEKKAREISEVRAHNKFNDEMGVGKTISLNELFKNQSDEGLKNLNLIIKCDVQGSIEAIKGLLDKIEIEGTKINIVGSRVGGITDNDISLAIASNAIIIGFNIRPTSQITELAKEKGIEIRLYNVIYKLQEDIEKAVKGMLDPVYEEKISGQAEVRQTIHVSKVGTIAGSYVTDGSIVRNGGVRLIRDSIVVYTGKMGTLKRFKDDVKEVKSGYECGITIQNFNDIKVGDIIECFIMEEVERD